MRAVVTVIAAAAFVSSAWSEARPARLETVHVRAHEPSAFADPPVRTYYVAAGASEAQAIAAQQALIRAGARHVNLILPDRIIVCELPLDASAERFAAPASFIRMGEREAARSSAAWVQASVESVDRARAAPPSRTAAADDETGAGFNDLLLVPTPDEVAAAEREVQRWRAAGVSPLAETAVARNMQQNSEILTGHIYAQFVFPESDGTVEAETEDWSDDDLASAVAGALQALYHWEGRFPNMDIDFTFEYKARAATGYEPIQHSTHSDRLWILDTLRKLGFSPAWDSDNAQTVVHEYNNVNRVRTGADWAFTAFVACARDAPGHYFQGPDVDYTAYSFLGGPYLVEPFPAGGDPNEIGDELVYSQIVNHEAGHIFWTLDEYIGAPGACGDESGYLAYPNRNLSMFGPSGIRRCEPYQDCIMHSAARQDLFRPWCEWSEGHLGVVDADNTGYPDVFESAPVIEFAVDGPETVATNRVSIAFEARSTAVPNRNPAQDEATRIDYAPPLGGATFSLGSGSRHELAAVDGAWDEVTEDCLLEFDIGTTGELTIEFRAKNAVGYESGPYRKEIIFLGVHFSSLRVLVGEGRIDLDWDVLGHDFGARYTLYRLEPGEAMPGTPIAEGVTAVSGGRYHVRDTDVTPGVAYRYYAQGAFELPVAGHPDSSVSYSSTTGVVDAVAMIPIGAAGMVSYVSPNPARDDLAFSIAVPETFVSTTAPGGVTQYQQRVATPVEVDVFDVAGRRVRRLYGDGEYRNVLTLHWDGRREDGRPVPNGVYFIRVQAGSAHAVRKVLFLR